MPRKPKTKPPAPAFYSQDELCKEDERDFSISIGVGPESGAVILCTTELIDCLTFDSDKAVEFGQALIKKAEEADLYKAKQKPNRKEPHEETTN